MLNKLRPQIIVALGVLGAVSILAIQSGIPENVAIVSGCTGGVIALGMKLLEGE
tara:strand:- start:934 stop:1095 length:162 start_codon:yes stop_codon:yes gene_type:complete